MCGGLKRGGGPEGGGPAGGGPPADRAIAGEDIDVDKSIVMTGGATIAALLNVVRNRTTIFVPSWPLKLLHDGLPAFIDLSPHSSKTVALADQLAAELALV